MNYRRILSLSESLLKTFPPSSSLHIPRASVAAIFRIVPPTPINTESVMNRISKCAKTEELERYLETQPWINSGDLQVLFVKRSINPRDVHSGNVAFPGGKLEKGESPYDAVIRETYEEIGVELLDSSKFVYLGHLKEIDPYYASFRNKKIFLSVHGDIYVVFLQYCPSVLPIKLNTDEIQSYRWTSFDNFTDEFDKIFHPISFFVSDSLTKMQRSNYKAELLRSFAGCILPLKPKLDTYNSSDFPPDSNSKYHLWGITYRRLQEIVFSLPDDLRSTSPSDWIYTQVYN